MTKTLLHKNIVIVKFSHIVLVIIANYGILMSYILDFYQVLASTIQFVKDTFRRLPTKQSIVPTFWVILFTCITSERRKIEQLF